MDVLSAASPARPDLLDKLDATESWFREVLLGSHDPDSGFELAAGWLLDNEHQVLRALARMEKDLPPAFFRVLPRLKATGFEGLPRAYILARRLLTDTRLQLSYSGMEVFFQTEQQHGILLEAELWAMPTLLRVVCIEHLAAAIAELLPDKIPPFRIYQLSAGYLDLPADERISGAIASLRVLADTDWNDLVDAVSGVEAKLLQDPQGIYPAMKQSSRNAYRREVEQLARYSSQSETNVVDAAMNLCDTANDALHKHVGYWLVDGGRGQLEQDLGYKPPIRQWLHRLAKRHAGLCYAVLLVSVGLCALLVPAAYLSVSGASTWMFMLVIALSVLPATDVAVQFVHWALPQLTNKATLHALDRHKLARNDCQCAVAVPVIVKSVKEVDALIEKLELRYLANTESYLRFVLLSDLADAPEQNLPEDASIEAALVSGVRGLNERYCTQVSDRFILLHREREYNAGEACWMGWERKRGKIEQFNAYLVEGQGAPFPVTEGDIDQLRGIKYVITLDADTMLPPGSAADLVCTFEHPLNQAVKDVHTGKVTAGYSMLQPRIETLEMHESMTRFAKLFTGDSAIDIYSHAVSDFHQDWLGTGNFVGKGIYHVASFHSSLAGRVPENRILSHDLFEGLHGRVALVSDIVLYESFPETWWEHSDRRHRWVRGDWQLLSWIGRHVPGPSGTRLANVFSVSDQWRLIDNLRRSLLPPVLLVYLLGAWFWFPGNALLWSLLALASFAPYLVNEALAGFRLVSKDAQRLGYLHNLKEQLVRWAVSVALIVPDAMLMLDAIVRTLWRQYASGKHRLQWQSSAHVAASHKVAQGPANAIHDYSAFKDRGLMVWFSPLVATAAATGLLMYRPQSLLVAAPVILAWLCAPLLVAWLSKPRTFRRDELSAQDRLFIRRAARATWHYFDRFVGPADNWLPPDNYQSYAAVGVAHRTSPTNIGLYLTSAVAAGDLGFIGVRELVVRIDNVLNTIDELPMHRGHLLNWYDTRSLQPLAPRYVSTVDSGNLALCLIATAFSCRDLASSPTSSGYRWKGLLDTLSLMRVAIESLSRPLSAESIRALGDIENRLNALSVSTPRLDTRVFRYTTLTGWSLCVHQLNQDLAEHMEEDLTRVDVIRTWMERIEHQIATLFRDVHALLPWLLLLDEAPSACEPLVDELLLVIEEGYPLERMAQMNDAFNESVQSFEQVALADTEVEQWLTTLKHSLAAGWKEQQLLVNRLQHVATRAETLAWSMDFKWLFDKRRRLFHIGYNVTSGDLDANHYDLLASEARLASFFAIAKHDVPLEHWFRLQRPLIRYQGQPLLRSWNGSMFEYLMPPLFLPGKRDTLIGESESLAVLDQQRHARKSGVPWGVSESAYAFSDADGNYQYKAFGTPGLGIRRGLADDTVIAPYASMLALGVWPGAAVKNLRQLESLGALGNYGFIDALDFTADRLAQLDGYQKVDTWMAHHQGMSMAAMLNVLEGDILPRRVLQDPRMRAVELLLQERIPWGAAEEPQTATSVVDAPASAQQPTTLTAWEPARQVRVPNVHLLGNGELSACLSPRGGGSLQYKQLALTRCSSDRARAHLGYRIHLTERSRKQRFWLGQPPAHGSQAEIETRYFQHAVEIVQRVDNLTIKLEALVGFSVNLDVRRVGIVNESNEPRKLLITSFAEIALAPQSAHERHPAFSKLFVSSREEADLQGVSFARRPRGTEPAAPIVLHRLVSDTPNVYLVGFETDRHRWFGRDRGLSRTEHVPERMSNTSGWVLDPVMALQVSVTLAAGEAASFAFVTCVGAERRAVLELAKRHERPALDRLFQNGPWLAAREAAHLRLGDAELAHLQTLASVILYPESALRNMQPAGKTVLPSQAQLWRYGISGDLPLLLLRVADVAESPLLDTLLRAQVLWRRRGLIVDIGIIQLSDSGYDDPLRVRVLDALRDTGNSSWLGRDGGVHLLPASQMTLESRSRVLAAAAVILDANRLLSEQLSGVLERVSSPSQLIRSGEIDATVLAPVPKLENLLFDNGMGGFDPDTSEYVIHMEPGRSLPSPWCNILANRHFGSIVSEAGAGFTWSENSGEHRLTPWSNDPVCDYQGEQLWLRDEITGASWTIAPGNRSIESPVQVRHGFGYTRWSQNSHALEQEQTILVPVDAPVKLVYVRVRNASQRARRVTATCYCEWVMEAMSDSARTHVVAEYEASLQSILARNHWQDEHDTRIAFLTASLPPHSVSGDRADFVDPLDPMFLPEGMRRSDLGGQFTPGKESCGSYQVHLNLAPDESCEFVFVLGEGADMSSVQSLVAHWASTSQVDDALAQLAEFWNQHQSAIQVRTPDQGFNLMINHWLPYQIVSSRLHARAGFYQAGGAFGFRDQLQDVLSCLASDPQRVRQQLLTAAAHQFAEGDVLHWWHPPHSKGVRTRISDDYLWLAYVAARYVSTTGDRSILDVEVPYLAAPELGDDEQDRYASYESAGSGSLFEHCCRAIEKGMRVGKHGLPLIGSGDWNDGMDMIGHHGRGESVWLAWFRIATIRLMLPIALSRNEASLASDWQKHATALKLAVDERAWDGDWFVRAFDDQGEPWGSRVNDECRIDLIAQAWGVLAGFGSEARVQSAMQAAEMHLMDKELRIIRLLTPAFNDTPRDPGYIKSYPPGIRENGGQYTHAAAWFGLAFARMGEGDKAFEVFDMINPAKRTKSLDDMMCYAREPYVLSADVGGEGMHKGRGGWSWYTGASSWTWQLGVNGILGIEYLPGAVRIEPVMPAHWDHVEILINDKDGGSLSVRIDNPYRTGRGVDTITVDGSLSSSSMVPFPGNAAQRRVVICLSEKG